MFDPASQFDRFVWPSFFAFGCGITAVMPTGSPGYRASTWSLRAAMRSAG